MTERDSHPPERRSERSKDQIGWLKEFFSQFEVAWKLFWDRRVPISTKLVPLLTLVYLLSPVDIVPDVVPGLGQVDDLMILLVGLRLFISLSPAAVVAEYEKLSGRVTQEEKDWDEAEIIDLEPEVPAEDRAEEDAGGK
ncbi:MAG: YkvA family protein [Anaerolineae bacterium]